MSRRNTATSTVELEKPYWHGLEVRSEQQARLLDEIAVDGLFYSACRRANVPFSAARNWIAHDKEFAALYKDALAMAAEYVRTIVRKRGIDGWEEPLSYQGMLTGDTITKYDHSLLKMEAELTNPEYKQKIQVNINTIPIKLVRNVDISEITGVVDAEFEDDQKLLTDGGE